MYTGKVTSKTPRDKKLLLLSHDTYSVLLDILACTYGNVLTCNVVQ